MLAEGAPLALLQLRAGGAHAAGTCPYAGAGIEQSQAEADVMAVSGSGKLPVLSREGRKGERPGASPGSAIVKGSVKGKSLRYRKCGVCFIVELMDTIAGAAIPSKAAHPELWGLRDRHTPPSHNPSLQSEEKGW